MKDIKTIKDITKRQKKILLGYFLSNQRGKGSSIIVAIDDNFEAYTYDLDFDLLVYTTVDGGSITLDCDITLISDIVIDKKIKRILINGELRSVKTIIKESFKLFEGLEG